MAALSNPDQLAGVPSTRDETDVDSDLCRTVISKSFPELRIECVQSLKEAINDSFEGWDCDAYIVNRELIFLFPKHHDGANLLRQQLKLLHELEPHLTIRIPQFEFASQGCREFPEAFGGYKMIKGIALTADLFKQECSEKTGRRVALQLAEFLSELHNFPIERAKELGVPWVPNKERWSSFYRDIEKKVFPLLEVSEQQWTRELFEDFLNREENFCFQPVLTHGDLSPEHIIFDRESRGLAGIIDFGDVRIGDPAYDFQFDYGDEFLQRVISHYRGQIDEAFLSRLEFYRWRWPFHEILYGLDRGKPPFTERGIRNLRRVVSAEKARR